jgi:hypothetical protein
MIHLNDNQLCFRLVNKNPDIGSNLWINVSCENLKMN